MTTLFPLPTVARMPQAREDAPDWTDSRDSFLWPDEQHGPWIVRVDWATVRGRYECVGLTVRSFQDRYWTLGDNGAMVSEDWPRELPKRHETQEVLTASVLRRLALGEALNDLRRNSADSARRLLSAADAPDADEIDRAIAAIGRHQASQWADSSTAIRTHGEVAAVYTAAWKAGRPPTKAVAEHFTISQSAAAKRVARARDAGLLPRTQRGVSRAHGEDD